MSITAEKIKAQISSLSSEDRADLAHFLIVSLDPKADDDAELAWDAELARREEQIRNGTAKGQRAEEVFAELRMKHS